MTTITTDQFKTLADTHLANYMTEAIALGIDPEKAVLGLFSAITTQIEVKHGVEETRRLLTDFVDSFRVVGGK